MRHFAKLLACGFIVAATAAPVLARAHDEPAGYAQGGYQRGYATNEDWNNGGANYDQFTQEYNHISQMISHGASDGSLNHNQIVGSWHELRYIRSLANLQRQRGYYNPQIIQARLTRLHDGLHLRHEQGHQAQERAYRNDRGGYGDGDHQRDDGYRNGDDHQDHHDHGYDQNGYNSPH